MINELLYRIEEQEAEDRDLLVDELNDLLERAVLTDDDVDAVVERLSKILASDRNQAVWESIFNLLNGLSGRTRKICELAVRYLGHMSPGSLVHALEIIAESDRKDKKQILNVFLNSENRAVKAIASEFLEDM